jgi:hypothetical protein
MKQDDRGVKFPFLGLLAILAERNHLQSLDDNGRLMTSLCKLFAKFLAKLDSKPWAPNEYFILFFFNMLMYWKETDQMRKFVVAAMDHKPKSKNFTA